MMIFINVTRLAGAGLHCMNSTASASANPSRPRAARRSSVKTFNTYEYRGIADRLRIERLPDLADAADYAALMAEALEAADIQPDGAGWFTMPCDGPYGEGCNDFGDGTYCRECKNVNRLPLPRKADKAVQS